jgi:hypothetical protein
MKYLIFIIFVWDENRCFIRDERDSTRGNISSDYDIKLFIFGYHKITKQYISLFHLIMKKKIAVSSRGDTLEGHFDHVEKTTVRATVKLLEQAGREPA